MKLVDANVLLRYLIDDNKEQAKTAADVIRNDQAYTYSEVLAEVVYVLEGVYGRSRTEIDHALENLFDDIYVYDEDVLRCTLRIYSVSKLDFVDCLIIARNLLRNEDVFSFDKSLNKHLHF
ncbi:MAG: PIN domain-containing protein [Raoultibacter sp.]